MSSLEAMQQSSHQFIVNFVTKHNDYAIDSTPYSIVGSTSCQELNSLITSLLIENRTDLQFKTDSIYFDFLVNGKLLRETIEELVEKEGLSYESSLQVEYVVKDSPPNPYNSLLHDDWVSCVDTYDNWIISGCYDSTAHIWKLSDDGQHMIAIPAHTAPVKHIKWFRRNHNNDYMFITVSHDESGIVWKWNSHTNQVEYVFSCRGHQRSVDCVDIHSDLIATGSYDQMLKVWSISSNDNDSANTQSTSVQSKKHKKNDGMSESSDKNRTPIITLSGHKEAITGCVWMKDTSDTDIVNVITCSMDNTIRFWDIEVGENTQTLTASKALLCLSYSPLNRSIITGSCDRHIRLFDSRSSQGSIVKSLYSSHQSWVSSIYWSTTNEYQFISGSYDNIVKQWDVRSTNIPLYDMIGHQDKVLCVNWSSPQHIISGGADNQLKIFSLNKN